jgi:hypothetical protein
VFAAGAVTDWADVVAAIASATRYTNISRLHEKRSGHRNVRVPQ